ncbi:MAG: D-tyrosyl-tRNA(Tyr) deacylase [Bacteroidetes bacterium]|nr:D-tyrosyl-tRNA(Tyr) deacylase [Bacteroidota bacterium]
MRVVVQRVKEGFVTINHEVHGRIDRGYVILLGIRTGDTHEDALFLADKCSALRVMEDARGKMNLSLKDAGGCALVVSQFTLYGDAQKGNRPSFTDAARPEEAEPLYNLFLRQMRSTLGADRVFSGVFGAMMDVTIVNDGPVTVLIESSSSQ